MIYCYSRYRTDVKSQSKGRAYRKHQTWFGDPLK